MKKLISLIVILCVIFAFSGCGENNIVVRGRFNYLKQAYENGWINEDDLKSIACCYYDWCKFEENPYSGLYEEPEELSKDDENELKQAYLEQIDYEPDGLLEKVSIKKYYGVYSGNLVVSMWSEYFMCDLLFEEEFDIGGVIFKNFWPGEILVYHI